MINIDHRAHIKDSKKNLNRMVLFNSFLYIFSHLPESLTTLMLIVYAGKISNFCQFNFSCDLVNEEGEFFSLISIVCQFYVFRIFDKNFKASFLDLKARSCCCLLRNQRDHNASLSTTPTRLSQQIELRNLNNLIGNGLID